LRYSGFLLSLSLFLYAWQPPYRVKIFPSPYPISSFTFCRRPVVLAGDRVFALGEEKLEPLFALPFRARGIYCFEDKLFFTGNGGIFDEKGRRVFAWKGRPLRVMEYRGDLWMVFPDKILSLGGQSFSLPSPPLILGRGAVVGRDWALVEGGKWLKLRRKVSFTGLRMGLAWWDGRSLLYASSPSEFCLTGERFRQFRVKGELKGVGTMKELLWAVTASGRRGKLLIFPRFPEKKIPPRWREQTLEYIPHLVGSNGSFLVVAGKLGPIEIYPSSLEFSFSIPGLNYSPLIDLRIMDVDGNGEEDMVMNIKGSFSENAWRGIAVLYSQMGAVFREIKRYERLYRRALRMGKYREALKNLEEALYLSNYVSFSRTKELFRERAALLRRMRRMEAFKNIGHGVLSLAVFLVLIFLLMRRRERERPPRDGALEEISGSKFLHTVQQELKALLSFTGRDFEEEWRRRKKAFEELYRNFTSPEASFEGASRVWRKLHARISKRLKVLAERPDRRAAEELLLLVLELRDRVHRLRTSLLSVLRRAVEKEYILASQRGIKMVVDLRPTGTIFKVLYPETAFKYETAFTNIIRNAIESFEGVEREIPVILVEGEEDSRHVFIRIKDNGKGIDPRDLDRIFSPGWTKGKEGGTGFGLAGVDELFKKYGHIEVHSTPGKGTEFIIRWYAVA